MGTIWLGGTVAFGLIFLGGQVYEFTSFYREGMGLTTNLFSQWFFMLVGFHGSHVAIGVLWLSVLLVAAMTGKIGKSRAMSVELAASTGISSISSGSSFSPSSI